MPILWRYLLGSYFKVLLISLFSIIAALLLMQFEDIARFATSGAPLPTVFLFTCFHIPYLSQIALPICCLLSALLLFRSLSHSFQITAVRSSGISLTKLFFPVLLSGAFLTFISLLLTLYITPVCRAQSVKLIQGIAEENPIFLFQKETFIRFKDTYIDVEKLQPGKKAEDILVITRLPMNERLSIIFAKHITLENLALQGHDVHYITTHPAQDDPSKDNLFLEFDKKLITTAGGFLQNQKDEAKIKNDFLTSKQLIEQGLTPKDTLELTKRISLGFFPFTFTLLGCAFGVEIGRSQRYRKIISVILLSLGFMIIFATAKSLKKSPVLGCTILYCIQPTIFVCSLITARKTAQGAE